MASTDPRLTSPNLLSEFELMVQQMRDNLSSLETRVANRTRDLQTAAEVSRQVATILDLDELLPAVVELTKTSFALYHVHIYLIDPNAGILSLAAGAGDAGRMMKERGHRILLNREQSLVARAARTRQSVIINDVTQEPGFLPNPMLPETQSEMAIPMIVGNTLIGVLDVQSNEPNHFKDEDARVQTTLASQIAVAIQNARTYLAQQEALQETEILYNASRKITSAASPSDQLEAIVDYAREDGAVSATLIYIDLDANGQPLWAEVVGTWELPGTAAAPIGTRFYLPEFAFSKLWFSNPDRPVLISDTSTSELLDPATAAAFSAFGVVGTVLLPLTVQGRWVGLASFSWNQPHTFTHRDERIYAALARQAAPGFEVIRLLEESNRQREHAELLARVNAALSEAKDENGIISAIAIATDHYKTDSATLSYLEYDAERKPAATISVAGWVGGQLLTEGPTLNSRYTMDQFPVSRFWIAEPNEVLAIEDLQTDPRVDENLRALLAPAGFYGLAMIPLHSGSEWQGLISLVWMQPHPFSAEELETYRAVQQSVSAVVATRRVALDLMTSERQYRQILDAIQDFVLVKGPKSKIIWANAAFRDYYGMSNEELQGMIDAPFVEPDYTQQYVIDDAKVFDGKKPLNIPEEPVTRYDGAVRLFNTLKTPIFNEYGDVMMSVGVSRDITEQKLSETERQVLFETAQALNNAQTPKALLEAAGKYPISKGCANVSLAYIENDERGNPTWLDTVGSWSREASVASQQTRYYLPDLPFTKFWTANPNRPTLVSDVETDSAVGEVERSLYRPGGVRGTVNIPLYQQNRWIGLITVTWKEPQQFTEQDQRIYTALAQQATPAVDAVRAAQETRKRALELETVAQVSTEASTTLNIDELLQNVTDLTKTSFNRYHVHIYLLDAKAGILTLAAGAGEAGRMMKERGHSILLSREQSLVARAARTRQSVIINDVTQEPDYLANPLLPNTRAEMALPMVVGDELIGVLDIQDDKIEAFHKTEMQVKQILASQIAVAVQNARAYSQVEQAQRETARIFNTSIDLIGSANFNGYFTRLNDAWEATIGWTKEELTAAPFVSFVHPDDVEMTNAEAAKLGEGATTLQFENRYSCKDGSYKWISWRAYPDMENALIHFVARDVTIQKEAEQERQILFDTAQALNNAQTPEDVLDAVKPYAIKRDCLNVSLFYIDNDEKGVPTWLDTMAIWQAEGSNPILETRYYLPEFPFTKLWTATPNQPTLIEDTETHPALVELRPLYRQSGLRSSVIIPLYLQNRWVGLIAVSWKEPQQFTEQDQRIYAAIAQQATPAVDAVRAAQETRKRAVELETVARVSTEASTNLNIDQLLLNVTDLTKASFNLYHTHVYLLEDNQLVLAAGAGEAGQVMKARGHRIPMNRENSIVAQCARTRQPVISNDVTSAPYFLPNPLLPETKSEMALPLMVGGALIGVLDVQSDKTNRFHNEDVQVQTTLAAQIAVAVQNARAFTRIEEQAELERATAERLREIDRLKSQFLANMSHELRTPLNSIIGYSEVLLDGDDGDLSPDALEDVETIHNSGRHLLSIINDILDLAKIEAGQMRMEFRPVALQQTVSEVLQTAQVLVKEKPVTLELVQDDAVPMVVADSVRLRQIVMNLVSNAAKFTEQGSVTVSLGKENDQYAYIKVKDTGIGIAQEDLGAIFEQFRQVDGSSTRRAGGTGLGLTITRYLVEMHGGEIRVESQLGAGTTFMVTLPVHVAEAVR